MPRPWLGILTEFHCAPIFGRISGTVAALALYAVVVLLIDQFYLHRVETVGAEYHGFLGLILGSLLVFRTTTSYDRWWEGRKLWGELVNHSRNLAIKVQTCVRAEADEKQRLGRWLSDFAFALKGHLRSGIRLTDLLGFAGQREQPRHVPAYIAARIYEQIDAWRRRDLIDGFELLILNEHAAPLMNICGACERIQKSPISISYRWFIRQMIAIYLLTLPWGLMESFHWWTIPAVAILGYFMIGVEMIAEVIEDPFGVTEDDLMLDDLCLTIERGVTDILATDSLAPHSAAPAL